MNIYNKQYSGSSMPPVGKLGILRNFFLLSTLWNCGAELLSENPNINKLTSVFIDYLPKVKNYISFVANIKFIKKR